MATYTKIGNKWRAQIRKVGRKSTSKTFPTKAAAERWAVEVEQSGAVASKLTVAEVIQKYREHRAESGRPVGKATNTHYMLKNLESEQFGLGPVRITSLDTEHLVAYCKLRLATIQPSTANMEIGQLGTVIRHTKSLLKLHIGDVVNDARPTLHHFGLIGQSKERTRRPTTAELEAIYREIDSRPRLRHLRDILTVALRTGMRRSEILRIRWLDLDEAKRTVIIRDRKHPKHKKGNDQEIPLLDDAWDIVQAQKKRKDEPRIFPYARSTISDRFKEIREKLGIENLKLHDMRHELISALFETGWTIPQVAAVSGHTDWRQLKRYTQIQAADLHDKVTPLRKVG